MDIDWKSDLEEWLAPFLGALGNKARSRICPAYVAGLIGSGDRKSIQPMAARDGQVGYDRLCQRRSKNASAGRSKNASGGVGGGPR